MVRNQNGSVKESHAWRKTFGIIGAVALGVTGVAIGLVLAPPVLTALGFGVAAAKVAFLGVTVSQIAPAGITTVVSTGAFQAMWGGIAAVGGLIGAGIGSAGGKLVGALPDSIVNRQRRERQIAIHEKQERALAPSVQPSYPEPQKREVSHTDRISSTERGAGYIR